MPEQLLKEKEIHCTCGKLLAKIGPDGKIKVWCKACRKEVPLLFVEQTADAFIDWFNSASDEEIKAAAGK